MTTGLVPIFATPFASLRLEVPEHLNAQLERLFAARASAAYRDPRAPANPFCFRSRDDLLDWPEEPVQQLRHEVLGAVAAAVGATHLDAAGRFDALRMNARGCFSLVYPQGCIALATYPMVSWCAVYCASAPGAGAAPSDGPVLRLYETRLAQSFVDASTAQMRPPFAFGHHIWQPAPGGLAVFPACQPHEITLNRGAGTLALVTVLVRFAAAAEPG